MKTIKYSDRRIWRLTALVAACAAGAWLLMPQINAADDQSTTSSFVQKVQRWEDEMTDKFRDTFKNLRSENKENSIGTASVDLREQPKEYVIRVNLPGRDLSKVACALEGDSLHIEAPAEAKAGRYEQSMVLANAVPNAMPDIKRSQKDGLIVVTVPKAAPSGSQGASEAANPSPSPALTDWDRQMFTQMQKMQDDMDRIFNNSFQAFQQEPGFKGFFDESRFGSSIDVQDENGNYIVKAYLPDRDMKNVSVTITNNDTLRIEAKAQEKKKAGTSGADIIHETEYSQMVTLPGPVNAGKMKVDKKDGMVVITIPKRP